MARLLQSEYQVETGQSLAPDTLIPLYLDRSLEMVIAILAVLKSGGAYVPMDPELPLKRKEHILKGTQARLVITYSELEDSMASTVVKLICVDTMDLYNKLDRSNLNTEMISRNLAYVIYTSGSTGMPKGVMVEHYSVHNMLFNFSSIYNDMAINSVFGLTSYTFDIFALETFFMWLSGGVFHLISETVRLATDQVIIRVDRFKPGLIQATPSLWQMISSETNQLPCCICGGETTSRDLLLDLYQKTEHLSHVYGPTETTVWSTQGLINPGSYGIGKAIGNTTCYIFDVNFSLVGVGQIGELYIGGDGLARGYLNQPDLTAEKFIENPFATEEDIAARS